MSYYEAIMKQMEIKVNAMTKKEANLGGKDTNLEEKDANLEEEAREIVEGAARREVEDSVASLSTTPSRGRKRKMEFAEEGDQEGEEERRYENNNKGNGMVGPKLHLLSRS